MSGKQQKDYPGSRDTLLSSDAWRADLARWTLYGEKTEAVSTHGQKHTKIQGEANAAMPEGCFANLASGNAVAGGTARPQHTQKYPNPDSP